METRAKRLDTPPGREHRLVELAGVEVRAPGDDGQPIGFKGTAAVFNIRTKIGSSMWGFFEEIKPGTFTQTIGEDDIRMLKNHNTDLVLARNTADNLRLEEKEKGLATDADMTPTSYARDLALSLEAGDVSQMSFGFEVKEEEWVTLDDDDPDKGKVIEPELRIIKRVKLWEVSPVTFPAFVDTDASLRQFRDLNLKDLATDVPLSDQRLSELACELRSADPDPEKVRALAKGLVDAAPAKAPSSETPSERSNRALASALYAGRW